MEPDSWTRFSKRHQSTIQSRYDSYLGGFEDSDDGGGDDDSKELFPCCFCFEDFDIIGLCCHMDDEHPVEAKNGVCPVCAARFGTDLVAHITMEHGNFFKMQRRRKFRKGSSGSHSAITFLRKELKDGNLHSLLGGSSYTAAPSSAAPDPLLSSFINLPVVDRSRDMQTEPFDEGNMVNNISDEKVVESLKPSLSDKDQKERAIRSEFVQELVLSTIFEDTL